MENRTAQILEAAIREFIETGEPVSSKQLAKKRDFGVKDATIRNELNDLMSEDFLAQPHISGGRIPTDKGYRFLVDKVMDEVSFHAEQAFLEVTRDLARELNKMAFQDFVSDMSDELEVLGVGYAPTSGELYRSGLDELFSRLIGDYLTVSPEETFQVIHDFEMLDERMSGFFNYVSFDAPKVFIGKSPITKSSQLSVIADKLDIGGEKFLLAVIGPKRMDYERTLKLFWQLRESVKQ